MSLEALRHSTSHVMAQAVQDLFPGTKLAIGPAIEDGFYYDFDIPQSLTPEDLPKIEARMQEIIAENFPFECRELSKKEAQEILAERGEKYKLELLEEIPDEKVAFYRHGHWEDLCRGPHLKSTGEIKAFKLLSIAGAYWRGEERRIMLQRIYGTAFPSKKELEAHITKIEEALRRDHRKLGKELDLFSLHEVAGAGFVYYHPKGAMLRLIIEDFLRKEHLKRGYEFVIIPHLAKIDLFKASGHTEYYFENMYFLESDKQQYVVKPMNCPGHILIFKRKGRSYRDLPIKYFELGTVYRYERSGVLHGLLRVRGFTQDDAHIFCTPQQLKEEINKVIDFAFAILKVFGFDWQVFLSTRPEKFVGSVENWEHATQALIDALKGKGVKYETDPGGGVFYGPKIDLKLKDALGRLWQGPTIQVDFNLPERFNLNYIGEDGKKYRPTMIHRALLGSLERFLGTLIEHYGGAFPLWLAPVQATILPIADRHLDYAQALQEELQGGDIRAVVDSRREKIGLKIREAELQKVPYMLIVGDKEKEAKNVSVRTYGKGDLGSQKIKDLLKKIVKESKVPVPPVPSKSREK